MAGANPLSKIEHVVVLMLENRSFDNVLGWLYDPANDAPFNAVPPDFDGLFEKNLSNPAPDGRSVPAGKTDDPRSPLPNPGEPFEDVYSQVYDAPKVALCDVPPDPPCPPSMQGFIRNYAAQENQPADPAQIMRGLTPKSLPVVSALAHHYALCDRWFSSVPSQTFSNRSFLHAGTSSGYVNNDGAGFGLINETPTVFDLLEQANKTWTVFCGAWLLQSFALLSQRSLWKYALTHHFVHFAHFFAAAARKGGLPNYSFLEPIYFDSIVWGPENDMHPECNPYQFFGPASVHRGEALVWKVYNAVRNGPDWERTILIILFDEHGGCYDHVPPPTAKDCAVAIGPDNKVIARDQTGGSGFRFDRLGPRVPAIIVSAYTPQQTRLHDVFEHTSVLNTLVNCFGLPAGELGRRQSNALDVSGALRLNQPRRDRPFIAQPHPSLLEDLSAEWQAIVHSKLLGAKLHPVSDLQRIALHCAALFMDDRHLHERINNLENQLQADQLRAEQESKLANKKAP